MASKERVVGAFAERAGIMDVSYMSETAQRLEAQHSLIFSKKNHTIIMIRLAEQGNQQNYRKI